MLFTNAKTPAKENGHGKKHTLCSRTYIFKIILFYSYTPDTSTVIITWLPSITLRSVSPLRKMGAKVLFNWAACVLSAFLLLFFSVKSREQKGKISWQILTLLRFRLVLSQWSCFSSQKAEITETTQYSFSAFPVVQAESQEMGMELSFLQGSS